MKTEIFLSTNPSADWRGACVRETLGKTPNGLPLFGLLVNGQGQAKIVPCKDAFKELGITPKEFMEKIILAENVNDKEAKGYGSTAHVRFKASNFVDSSGAELVFDSFKQGLFGERNGFSVFGEARFVKESIASAAIKFVKDNLPLLSAGSIMDQDFKGLIKKAGLGANAMMERIQAQRESAAQSEKALFDISSPRATASFK